MRRAATFAAGVAVGVAATIGGLLAAVAEMGAAHRDEDWVD